MLEAAIGENPGAEILVRLHPEVISGVKRGYLAELARRENLAVMAQPINPWRLFEEVAHVYTVSSQLGLEALMAGCRVTCFGCPFYAGWGLTDDRQEVARRRAGVTLDGLIAAAYRDYSHYFDAWTREPVDVFTACEQLAFLAGHFHRRWRPVVGWRVSRWKRDAISRMLDGAGGPVSYERDPARAVAMAKARGGAVAAWGRRADVIRPAASAEDVPVITMEDGFLRSVGLGAGFTPALSYVFDQTGIYYDPAHPSDIETLLNAGGFDAALLERAGRLIAYIRSSGVTKYNLASRVPLPEPPAGREVVLVPGQVADDESIRRGAADLSAACPLASGGANLELLRRVRASRPEAFIVYRPHPDVEAGFRHGRIASQEQRRLADHIDTGSPLNRLLERIDRVETATSLLGFEALLRGRPVTVHAGPFYAGWGLTEDLAPLPRRGRRCSLEELTAAALICYPVYLDPVSRRVCTVEQVANQLLEAQNSPPLASERLRRLLGAVLGRARGVAQKAQLRINRLKL
jgi:capsular polysaccharide export protein